MIFLKMDKVKKVLKIFIYPAAPINAYQIFVRDYPFNLASTVHEMLKISKPYTTYCKNMPQKPFSGLL
jgi:hypothetical protein